MQTKAELLARITTDPEVMLGKPIIVGTRLTVQHILKMLAQGIATDEILLEYNYLTPDDILACLTFASETLENTTFAPFPNSEKMIKR